MKRLTLAIFILILLSLPVSAITPSVVQERNEVSAKLMKAAIETFKEMTPEGLKYDDEEYVSLRYTNNKRVVFAMAEKFDFPKSGSAREIWEDEGVEGLMRTLRFEKLILGVMRTEYEISDLPKYHVPAGDYMLKAYVDNVDDVMYVGFFDEKGNEKDRVQTNFEEFDPFSEPKEEKNDKAEFQFSRFEPGRVNNFYGAIRVPFVLDERDFNRYFLLKLRFRLRSPT
jgi:hypothetical protein